MFLNQPDRKGLNRPPPTTAAPTELLSPGAAKSLPASREQDVQASKNSGGVTASLTQAFEPGNATGPDMVGQLGAKNSLLANLAVLRTSDKMQGARCFARREVLTVITNCEFAG